MAALEYNISKVKGEISGRIGPIDNSCDKLVAFAEFYRDTFDKISQRGGCPILNAAIDSDNTELPFRDFVIRSIEDWMRMIILIVRRCIKKREIKEGIDAETFATLFVTFIEGGFMLSKVTGKRIHLDRNIDYLINKINAELRI